MKYRTALLAAASLTLAACAQQNFSTKFPTAVGVTDAYYKSTSSTSTYKEYLRFEAGALTKIVFCQNGDARVRVEVTAPAKLTDATVEVLADEVAVEPVGDVECVAKLDKGLSAYEMNEDEDLRIAPEHGWVKHYLRAGRKRAHILRELISDLSYMAGKSREVLQRERARLDASNAENARETVASAAKLIAGVKKFGKIVSKNVRKSWDDAAENPYVVTP